MAKLVRGMRVEDALLQLQVTVKRAAKTVYQVFQAIGEKVCSLSELSRKYKSICCSCLNFVY